MQRGPREKDRRFDIDWVRVIAILFVFFFHCARFFNDEGWHVKNNELSCALSHFVFVNHLWIMPVFFFLSGVSSHYSLCKGAVPYLRSRVTRLLIPLVFGTLVVIAPLQVWIERVSHGEFAGSFLEFYPLYFKGWYGFGGNFAWMGLHLWYLEILFIFTIITYPLFSSLRKGTGLRHISALGDALCKPYGIFLLSLPIVVMELLANLDPAMIGRRDWGGWSLLSHLAFFVNGYVVALNPELFTAARRHKTAALAAAVVCTVALYAGKSMQGLSAVSRYFAGSALHGLVAWFWIVAVTGFTVAFLGRGNRFLTYANEAVLPFYILHQTVIVFIGFNIAGWRAAVPVKYTVLAVLSFATIMLLYEFMIRRVAVLRFLFGMR